MAKKTELFDIVLSKSGDRMVAKLNAKKLVVTNYKGDEITLTKGDYLDVADIKQLREDLDFLLTKEYINQQIYDKKTKYLDMVEPSFRARVTARVK